MAEEQYMKTDGALDWDSDITKDDEYEILPEGTYTFKVEALERGRYNGSDKMGACPVANITLSVVNAETEKHGKILDSLYLHAKAEWRLSQFFTAIGQKKKGETLKMDWNMVPGSTGRLELTINEYTKKDGSKAKNNRVGKYLPPEAPKAWTPGKGF